MTIPIIRPAHGLPGGLETKFVRDMLAIEPTVFERHMRVVRRSEPFDAFGDGLTVCFEDEEHRDRVLVVGAAGETVHALSVDTWDLLRPLIPRPNPGDLLRELGEEIARLQPGAKRPAEPPPPTNRRGRRAAAARARRGVPL